MTLSATVLQTQIFLSTPSGWRATKSLIPPPSQCKISIHALRVEGDSKSPTCRSGGNHFYPRPPGGGRQNISWFCEIPSIFLSTPSGWRATFLPLFHLLNFNQFLSTPSGWRATRPVDVDCYVINNFYPRPPGGGRPHRRTRRGSIRIFLSTPSGWRATFKRIVIDGIHLRISIHALRVEGDSFAPPLFAGGVISIHALRVEGDQSMVSWFTSKVISIHALRVEGDTSGELLIPNCLEFLSTPSGWRATFSIARPLIR